MVTFRPFKGDYFVIPVLSELLENNRGRVETQPRCKIQYPMKNRSEDAYKKPNGCIRMELFFINTIVITLWIKKSCTLMKNAGSNIDREHYFFIYITSFTSFTVRETSGKAAATRFGA